LPLSPWPVESSEELHRYAIYSVRRDRLRSPKTGKVLDFYIVDAPEAVHVIALTADDEVVMVEQVRHGIRQPLLELPGGMLDDDGPVEGARRELREETGYEAEELTHLGALPLNPAWTTTLIHVVLATGARRTAEKEEDEGEDTRLRCVPRQRLREMVAAGEITSMSTLASLYLLEARQAG
jgi:8-oxo-dGTP pyrophosphatase MutT (NUDIX family)